MSPQVVLFKEIKPSRLQVEAMNNALTAQLELVASEIFFQYEATAWNWKRKVKFVKEISVGPNSVDVLVGTDDEIYKYVDEGTKSHTIKPKNKPYLAFKVGGKPKTMPGVMVSGAGAPGTQWVRTKLVKRNKTKARKFTKTIQKEWEKKFKRQMEMAMKKAAHDSGHLYME